ncbi:hypothetical protein [Tatumella morbirosei]|uniref:hypothetical protein n=1 Tax=Tatumella morbirosei TaxID=642227 RepID=UPI00056DD91C|nr:hypothetical protein [Tatumella morbirosei]
MNRAVEDYSGSDAAKIRVLDKGKLSLVFYEWDGDCYKEVETRKLTSTFHLSLLSSADYSTGFSKKINMQTLSSFGNKKVKEYVIRAGGSYRIVNANSIPDYYGSNIVYKESISFVPEKNHEYEVYAKDPEYIKGAGNIVISDLTTHEIVKTWNGKVCS